MATAAPPWHGSTRDAGIPGSFCKRREAALDDDSLRFEGFVLSRRQRQLASPTGPVALGGRAFDLLLVLMDRGGDLVSKQELLALIWPGLIVEDNNVQVQVATLRRALGEHHTLVQTVPGRGYRFTGITQPNQTATAAPPPPSDRRPAARPPGLAESAQAPFTQTPLRESLGAPSTPLIGRQTELAELAALIASHRLVTLTGPSGIGKTRLAIALAQQTITAWPGGIALVELAPVPDPAALPGVVLAALGVSPTNDAGPQAASLAAIIAALHKPASLLLLDNCEHLTDAVATLADTLLRACPALTILATSHERLHVGAEAVYRLDPLGLPPPGWPADTSMSGTPHPAPSEYGALSLFVERLAALDHRFVLDAQTAPVLAAICRTLDGIPLALEMAAARVPMLGLAGLLTRLDQRLRMLTNNDHGAPPRHRTLRATVAWSVDLLAPADQRVFARLGVFAGGFTAEAASAIAAEPGADAWDVIDALGRLIDKSLVVAGPGPRPRYRLLETLRLFALDQLGTAAERASVGARHAQYYRVFMHKAYAAWEHTEDAAWLRDTAPELENIRLALTNALRTTDPAGRSGAISLAGSAALLWDRLAVPADAAAPIAAALALLAPPTQPDLDPADIARLWRQAGNLWRQTDPDRALEALAQAASWYRAAGDHQGLGSVLALSGPIRIARGQTAAAEIELQQACTLLSPEPPTPSSTPPAPKSLVNALNGLGVLAALAGDLPTARARFAQVLAIARQRHAAGTEALALVNLAELDFQCGQAAAAADCVAQAAIWLRADGRRTDLAWALVNQASYLLCDGQPQAARSPAIEALALDAPANPVQRAAVQLAAAIALAIQPDHLPTAATAASLRGWVDAAGTPAAHQTTERRVAQLLDSALHAALPPPQRARHAQHGALWTQAQAVALARRLLQPTPSP